MTLPFDFYPWFALGSSILLLILFGHHALLVSRRYRRADPEDIDASASLLVSMTLLIGALGLTVSAVSLFVLRGDGEAPPPTVAHDAALASLSVVRGAMLLCATVLFIVDRRRRE